MSETVSIYIVKIAGKPWHWMVQYNGEHLEGDEPTMRAAMDAARCAEDVLKMPPLELVPFAKTGGPVVTNNVVYPAFGK